MCGPSERRLMMSPVSHWRPRRLVATRRIAPLALAALIAVATSGCQSAAERARAAAWADVGVEQAASLRRVMDERRPSIVSIKARKVLRDAGQTGCIVHPDGLVLTAAHGLGVDQEVELDDGERRRAAVLLVNEVNDYALLAIQGPRRDYPALGIAEAFAIGDPVLAVGRPVGGTVHGAPGAIVWDCWNGPIVEGNNYHWNVIVHDAPLFPGDSGGPLLDSSGRLVGINVAGAPTLFRAVNAGTFRPLLDWLASFRRAADVRRAVRTELRRCLEERRAPRPEFELYLRLEAPREPADLAEMIEWTLAPVLERRTTEAQRTRLRPRIDAIVADAVRDREGGVFETDRAAWKWATRQFLQVIREHASGAAQEELPGP